MTTAEKIELTLIPLIGVASWFLAALLPTSTSVGKLLMWTAALLLLQGLLRDLWLLSRADQEGPAGDEREAQCLCMESTVGIAAIVLGVLLLASTLDIPLLMSALGWSLLVVAMLTMGFLMKDWVIEWNPWRIRRERGHVNLVVKWRR